MSVPDGAVETESATTDFAGSTTVSFPALTEVGTYGVQATFSGDTTYGASASSVSEFQSSSNVAVNYTGPASGTAGVGIPLKAAVVTTPAGTPVTNASLTVDYAIAGPCGKSYAVAGTTGPDGTATATFIPPSAGPYVVVATSEGTPAYGPAVSPPVTVMVTGTTQSPFTPVCVTVTGAQTYGGSPTFTVPTPLPAGVTSTGPVTCLTVDDGKAIAPTVGVNTYTIDGSSCTGLSADSDHVLTFVGGPFVVAPAALTITASSPTVQYGHGIAVTPSYGGFVAGDTAASLTTQPTCASTAPANPAPGTYSTSCSGAVDANYTIRYVSGTLTVDKASTTLTAAPAKNQLLRWTLSATLTRRFDGTGLGGQTVIFSVQGQQICQATTNMSGVASCSVIGLVLGPATYTATYAGDSDYLSSTATGKL